ncbi:MAG: hypothetical protein AAGC92_05185 [Pseudomonadota bacterium]
MWGPIGMASVYIATEVADVLALHPYLADRTFRALPVREQVAEQAATLWHAHRAGDPRIGIQIMSWWPRARGVALGAVMAAPFSEADALLTVSREHGFADWAAVAACGALTLDAPFEAALDAMLAGSLSTLTSLIAEDPVLVSERSVLGHRATLLHYLGANGVETHRQRVPLNAVELARALIVAGASRMAEAIMYGGKQTPYLLANSSAHPRKAGIAAGLARMLAPQENAAPI